MAQQLPPHEFFNHQIRIKEGKEVPLEPIYDLLERELEALRAYLDRMVVQGKITKSNANMGTPIIFVSKPNEELRLYVDNQELNVVTIKDPYPLPLIDKLKDQVVEYEWFTKLNLRDGYYLARLKDEESENVTTMRTRYGNSKYKVMLFRLINAPTMFQYMMNTILQPLLDQGVVVYLNNILIYIKTLEEYRLLVTKVFFIPQKEELASCHTKIILQYQGSRISEINYQCQWRRNVYQKG
jgi:hypothetical protein